MTSSKAGRIATLAVSVAVLAVLVWRVDPRRVSRDFEGVRWGWVIATACLNLANTGIEAVRWRLLAKPVAPGVRLRSTFNGLLAGTLGNVLLPFKLGDGARAYVFAEAEGIPLAAAISFNAAPRGPKVESVRRTSAALPMLRAPKVVPVR